VKCRAWWKEEMRDALVASSGRGGDDSRRSSFGIWSQTTAERVVRLELERMSCFFRRIRE
jgi:hypothetical protein